MNGDIMIAYLENVKNMTPEYKLAGHNDDVCSLAFSFSKGQYDDGILASVSRDGFVKIWDTYSRNNLADVKLDANRANHKNWFSLAILPIAQNNNKFEILIGSGNGDILVIEIPTKPPSSKIRVHRPSIFNTCQTLSHNNLIFTIAIDIKAMLAITTSLDHQIIVWDLKERKALNCFYTLTHGVHDISMSSIDPTRLAIAIGDGMHIIKFDKKLNVEYQHRIPIFSKVKGVKGLAVVWHPELENRLAFGSSLGEITVIDTISSQISIKYSTRDVKYDSTKVYCMVWGPALDGSDSYSLYCVHQSGELYLHNPSNQQISNFTNYIEDKKKRTEIRWKTNYKHLAVGNQDGTIAIFELKDKKLDLVLNINAFSKSILSLKWNSDMSEEISNMLAVSSYDGIHCYFLNEYLRQDIDRSDSENWIATVTEPSRVLKAHLERVSSICWSPFDALKLVSVSYDKTAQIWDVAKEIPIINFRGHKGILYCVLWSAFDEDVIFSGGEDNFFHAWRKSKQRFETPNAVNGIDSNLLNKSDNFGWPHLEQCDDNEEIHEINGESRQNKEENHEIIEENNEINEENQNNVQNDRLEYNGIRYEECVRVEQIQKSKIKSNKKKINKENKKLSLFPLSNSIENCSPKYEKLEDIEALYEKMNGNKISAEKLDRILLYGSCEDIKLLLKKELAHHQKYGNNEPKDILNLLSDIKSTVEESIEQKTLNSYLVLVSVSVSRDLWKKSCEVYAQQLAFDTETQSYKRYNTEISAILQLSLNNIKGAIDLFLENGLYREALIVAKLRYESDETIEHIMTRWADSRKNSGDFEGAAKCLTAINKFEEAAKLLLSRNDQQYDHTVCLLRSKK
jgi:gem associated protein 5